MLTHFYKVLITLTLQMLLSTICVSDSEINLISVFRQFTYYNNNNY